MLAGVIATPSAKTPDPEYVEAVVLVPIFRVPLVKSARAANVEPVKLNTVDAGKRVSGYDPQKKPVISRNAAIVQEPSAYALPTTVWPEMPTVPWMMASPLTVGVELA
jgi:hypothetical protein